MELRELGTYISAERVKRGWSLYRLSLLSGVSIRHLQLIEDGSCDVRLSTLQKILNAFNQDVNFIDLC